jgi:hypothetical protein
MSWSNLNPKGFRILFYSLMVFVERGAKMEWFMWWPKEDIVHQTLIFSGKISSKNKIKQLKMKWFEGFQPLGMREKKK